MPIDEPNGKNETTPTLAPSRPPPEPGFIVRRLMHERGLTEQKLADAAAVRLETVNRIVCGRTSLSPSMAHAIAELLGTTPEHLLRAQTDWQLWILRTHPDGRRASPRSRRRGTGLDQGLKA